MKKNESVRTENFQPNALFFITDRFQVFQVSG